MNGRFPKIEPKRAAATILTYLRFTGKYKAKIFFNKLYFYLCMMKQVEKQNVRHLSLQQLEQYFVAAGEPKFRAKQVYEWIWQKHARSFEDMSNLGKALRVKLDEQYLLPALTIETVQHSDDGTIKSRFMTVDHHMIEGVLIPTDERKTACVSSQIGCSLSCKIGRAHV